MKEEDTKEELIKLKFNKHLLETVQELEDKKRIFLDIKEKEAFSSGLFVKIPELKKVIKEIESTEDIKVIGFAYDGSNTIELITKPKVSKNI